MKLLAAAFALLLVFAHLAGDARARLGLPLSLFRDADPPAVGYALFALLGGVGAWYAVWLVRCRRFGDTVVVALAVVLLGGVAATPSFDAGHFFYSMLLLGLLYGYFAFLLWRGSSVWLFAHLAVPLLLTRAVHYHSYGAWQKSLILYFVFAVTLHHHRLTRAYAEATKPTKRRKTEVRVNFRPRRP